MKTPELAQNSYEFPETLKPTRKQPPRNNSMKKTAHTFDQLTRANILNPEPPQMPLKLSRRTETAFKDQQQIEQN